MELRDVVGSLVAFDDEQRALTNELNRALDAFGRAVLPVARFGIEPGRLSALESRLAYGSDEAAAIEQFGKELVERVVETAWGLRQDQEGAFRTALSARLEELRRAESALSRLRDLLRQRREVERQLARLKKSLDADEETTELIEIVLAAREAAADGRAHDSKRFLDDAQSAARDDGALAGTASNVRALREALAGGEDAAPIASDLSRRVVDLAVHAGQQRDDLSRRLAALERDAERRQEISHGLFQAVTKASEVLELATTLERRLEGEGLPDGALGPLKAACIEHGVITLLLELRRLRLDRGHLDLAMSDLSQALGDLFAALAHEPDRVERLSRVWEDLATVDAGAIEQAWEDAYARVLGVQHEGGGVLSVSKEDLARLAGADGLDPWLDLLVQRVDERLTAVSALVERLEGDDRVLSVLVDESEVAREQALAAKRCLAHFVGEVTHSVYDYHERVRKELLQPDSGFRRVQRQVAGFVHAEELAPDADEGERREAFRATLEEVRLLFADLEARLPAGGDAAEWKEAEEGARNQVTGAYRDLAGTLARLQRLRSLLFPPLNPACKEALELAARLGAEPELDLAAIDGAAADGAAADGSAADGSAADGSAVDGSAAAIDQLSEALEALYLEKLYHEALRLPPGSEVRPVAGLARVRNRRLLDLHGASLTLLFGLLSLLSRQYEELDHEERPGHLSWMEELLLHAGVEMDGHFARLDDCLFDLADNKERLARYLGAFDAYHRWAATVAETDAGHDLLRDRGNELYTGFEDRLRGLGEGLIARLGQAKADWRVSSTVESLIALHDLVLQALESRPTFSKVEKSIASLKERAESLKRRIAAEADLEEPGLDGSALFR